MVNPICTLKSALWSISYSADPPLQNPGGIFFDTKVAINVKNMNQGGPRSKMRR